MLDVIEFLFCLLIIFALIAIIVLSTMGLIIEFYPVWRDFRRRLAKDKRTQDERESRAGNNLQV